MRAASSRWTAGPTVAPFTDKGRDSLLAGDRDHVGGEALLVPVVNLRHAHHRRTHASRCHRDRRLLRHSGGSAAGRRHIILRRGAAGRKGQPGRDDEGPIRAFKRVADHLDGTPVGLAVLREF